MKHLLLSLVLIISANAWADMDKICYLELQNDGYLTEAYQERIKQNCERNNILIVTNLKEEIADWMVVQYCRYDRNVGMSALVIPDRFKLTCVLYDNEPREFIETK